MLLSLNNVSRIYGSGHAQTVALDGVTVAVAEGEFLGIVGPSGCGKSTLLNIVGLSDTPTTGTVSFQGNQVDFSSEAELRTLRRTQIGFVFQQFHLLPTLNAIENIMVTPLLNGVSLREARASAEDALRTVGLWDRRNHPPHELSGGEMQRVAVCRALAHKPRLVVADEPTGSLDTESGDMILDLLSSVVKTGVTVIMATHSDRAMARLSRVVRLRDGREVTELL